MNAGINQIVLDSRETLILSVLVLFLGKILTRRIKVLSKYNIPEPVSGGVLFSILIALIYFAFKTEIEFDLHQRDALLVVFFTCIGLSSKLSVLAKGGKQLILLLVLALSYLFIQNFTGVGIASISGMDPNSGLIGGSISLSGGHGTAIAWSSFFREDLGISNAMELGIACATFGLVLGGVIGGPIANYLIKKDSLEPSESNEGLTVGVSEPENEKINVDDVYSFILILCTAIGLGLSLNDLLDSVGVKMPTFVTCLFGGIIMTNTIPVIFKNVKWPTGKPTIAIVSNYSLGIFLAMSLMSLQLWSLLELALPIVMLLVAQVIVVTLFTLFVLYRLMGRNYDAAIISSGYAGLAMGATPTAIANMTAVTKKFGASPQAFILIPIVGAFFIDIFNAMVIKVMLSII